MRTAIRWGTAAVVAFGCSHARAEIVDGIAVVVNGDAITLSEIQERPGINLPPVDEHDRYCKTLRRAAEEAVTDHLVEKQCSEEGITPTPQEIDNAIEDVQHSNGNIDRATLEKALQAQGMTMPVYRDMLARQLCQMKLFESKVKSRIQVPEDDIRGAYNQLAAGTKSSRQLKLRDIFIPMEGGADAAKTRMQEAVRRVQAGEDFAKVAKEIGGPLSANAGDLGWLKPGDLNDTLKPVLSVPKGGTTGIIETPDGLHLVKVEDDRMVSDLKPYAEMHDQLKAQLTRERMGKSTEDFLAELRRNADIEYKLPCEGH